MKEENGEGDQSLSSRALDKMDGDFRGDYRRGCELAATNPYEVTQIPSEFMTDNHNYNMPQEGATDWHNPLNNNFERLDTDIEIRDIEANRSNYEPKTDAKYIATDTGSVFIGDGQQWNHLGSIQKLPGDILVQSTEPRNPSQGDLWIDTSSQ